MSLNGKFLDKNGLTYLWSKLKTKFAAKQDTIADLSEIRSGAAAGATAVQQTAFETDQARQETEIGVVANAGAKNLFDIQHPSMTRSTEYNATSDGGVELACSNAVWTRYIIGDIPVESGSEYDFTLYVDAISGTDTLRVYVRDADSSGNILFDTGNISATKTITRKITSSAGKFWAGIYLNNSATAKTASAKIRGMLRRAEITDDTFVPYAPTNRELYETCETKITMQQAYGEATVIPANSNLNDYTTSGLYYALIANVPTITNTPYTATGFRVVVEKNTHSGPPVFQTLYPTSRTHLEFYRRVYEGGSWSSWRKFEGTVVS